MKLIIRCVLSVVLLCLLPLLVCADEFDDLARDFWKWRAVHQPVSTDDIPRIDRPAQWSPDWSASAIAKRRQALVDFEQRWRRINAAAWPVARQVDYRLIGSALARVRWELEITREWQRNPRFYLSQTLGAVFDRLLQPPPFDATRSSEIVQRMKSIPRTVEDAKANLSQALAPFAKLAIDELKDVRPRLLTVAREIKPLVTPDSAAQLDEATAKAADALESYRAWL